MRILIVNTVCGTGSVGRICMEQARQFRPTAGKLVLTAVCLVVSILFFSGVDTFIYANF